MIDIGYLTFPRGIRWDEEHDGPNPFRDPWEFRRRVQRATLDEKLYWARLAAAHWDRRACMSADDSLLCKDTELKQTYTAHWLNEIDAGAEWDNAAKALKALIASQEVNP